jgi:hypothetical protein
MPLTSYLAGITVRATYVHYTLSPWVACLSSIHLTILKQDTIRTQNPKPTSFFIEQTCASMWVSVVMSSKPTYITHPSWSVLM